MDGVRDWPGREYVETLSAVARNSPRRLPGSSHKRNVLAGALLIGSLARGEGDAISDVDLVAVARPGRWSDAWDRRSVLSAGALVTFDRSEGKAGIAGHSWITPSLVKVECLITEPGRTRIAGTVVVVMGEDNLLDGFERSLPFTSDEMDDYAADLREANAISDIECAYGDLIALLRREIRQ
jgi:hypothetical protein